MPESSAPNTPKTGESCSCPCQSPAVWIALVLAAAIGAVVFFTIHDPPKAKPEAQPPVTPPPVATSLDPTNPKTKSEILAVVLNKDSGQENRIQALRKLTEPLTKEECGKVQGLATTRDTPATLRHVVVEVLESQPEPVEGLGSDLVMMWKTTAEDPIWRDFCLQHMERVYDRAKEKALLEQALTDAAEKTAGGLGGTALLSMQRLGKRHPKFAEKAQKIALSALSGETLDEEKAVTALQVAAATGATEVTAKARAWAADPKRLVRLRMSAIATLGEQGTKDDIPIVEKLAKDSDDRIRRVAEFQLKNLKKKFPAP